MTEEKFADNFDYYLKFAKPLVLNLPDPKDRVLAAAWIKKLSNGSSGSEIVRKNYLKILLFVLHKRRLYGVFLENPDNVPELIDFNESEDILSAAKENILKDDTERRKRFLKGLGGGDYPPYSVEYSADLLEYAAAQDIPKFGVQGYYAFSFESIRTWNNIENVTLPQGAVEPDKSLVNIRSFPSISEKSTTAKSIIKSPHSPSKAKEQKASFPAKDKSKGRRGTITDDSRMPTDRMPITWGSNLIDVTESPKRDVMLDLIDSTINESWFSDQSRLMNISQAPSLPYRTPPRQLTRQERVAEMFAEQILRDRGINISAGSREGKDIVEEANQTLQESTVTEEDFVDQYEPYKRKDMPVTPPAFSRYKQIREGPAAELTYSPHEFGIEPETDFQDTTNIPVQPPSEVPRTPKPPRLRYKGKPFEKVFPKIEGEESFQTFFDTQEPVLESFESSEDEELDDSVPTLPSEDVNKKLNRLMKDIGGQCEESPAASGIGATSPRSPTTPQRRRILDSDFPLFTETMPEYYSPVKTAEDRAADQYAMLFDSPTARVKSPPKTSPKKSPAKPKTPVVDESFDFDIPEIITLSPAKARLSPVPKTPPKEEKLEQMEALEKVKRIEQAQLAALFDEGKSEKPSPKKTKEIPKTKEEVDDIVAKQFAALYDTLIAEPEHEEETQKTPTIQSPRSGGQRSSGRVQAPSGRTPTGKSPIRTAKKTYVEDFTKEFGSPETRDMVNRVEEIIDDLEVDEQQESEDEGHFITNLAGSVGVENIYEYSPPKLVPDEFDEYYPQSSPVKLAPTEPPYFDFQGLPKYKSPIKSKRETSSVPMPIPQIPEKFFPSFLDTTPGSFSTHELDKTPPLTDVDVPNFDVTPPQPPRSPKRTISPGTIAEVAGFMHGLEQHQFTPHHKDKERRLIRKRIRSGNRYMTLGKKAPGLYDIADTEEPLSPVPTPPRIHRAPILKSPPTPTMKMIEEEISRRGTAPYPYGTDKPFSVVGSKQIPVYRRASKRFTALPGWKEFPDDLELEDEAINLAADMTLARNILKEEKLKQKEIGKVRPVLSNLPPVTEEEVEGYYTTPTKRTRKDAIREARTRVPRKLDFTEPRPPQRIRVAGQIMELLPYSSLVKWSYGAPLKEGEAPHSPPRPWDYYDKSPPPLSPGAAAINRLERRYGTIPLSEQEPIPYVEHVEPWKSPERKTEQIPQRHISVHVPDIEIEEKEVIRDFGFASRQDIGILDEEELMDSPGKISKGKKIKTPPRTTSPEIVNEPLPEHLRYPGFLHTLRSPQPGPSSRQVTPPYYRTVVTTRTTKSPSATRTETTSRTEPIMQIDERRRDDSPNIREKKRDKVTSPWRSYPLVPVYSEEDTTDQEEEARNVRARAEAQYMQLMMADTIPKRKQEMQMRTPPRQRGEVLPDLFYREEAGGILTREGIPVEIFATSPSYKYPSPPKVSPKAIPKASPKGLDESDWMYVNVDDHYDYKFPEINVDLQSPQKEAAQEDVLTVSGFLQKHLESEEPLKPKKSKSKLRKPKGKLKPKKSKSKIKKTKSLKEKQSEPMLDKLEMVQEALDNVRDMIINQQPPERTIPAYREEAYIPGMEELVADIPVPNETVFGPMSPRSPIHLASPKWSPNIPLPLQRTGQGILEEDEFLDSDYPEDFGADEFEDADNIYDQEHPGFEESFSQPLASPTRRSPPTQSSPSPTRIRSPQSSPEFVNVPLPEHLRYPGYLHTLRSPQPGPSSRQVTPPYYRTVVTTRSTKSPSGSRTETTSRTEPIMHVDERSRDDKGRGKVSSPWRSYPLVPVYPEEDTTDQEEEARNVRARAEAQYMQLMMVDTTPKRKREFPDVFYKEEKGGFLTREGIPEEIFATSPSYKHQSPPKVSPKPSPKSFEEYDWINVSVDDHYDYKFPEINIDLQSPQKEAAQEDVLTVSGFLQKHLESEEPLKPKRSKSKLRKPKGKLKPKKSKSKIKKTKSLKEKQSEPMLDKLEMAQEALDNVRDMIINQQPPERTIPAYREEAYIPGMEELVADIPVPNETVFGPMSPRSPIHLASPKWSPKIPLPLQRTGQGILEEDEFQDSDYSEDFGADEFEDADNIYDQELPGFEESFSQPSASPTRRSPPTQSSPSPTRIRSPQGSPEFVNVPLPEHLRYPGYLHTLRSPQPGPSSRQVTPPYYRTVVTTRTTKSPSATRTETTSRTEPIMHVDERSRDDKGRGKVSSPWRSYPLVPVHPEEDTTDQEEEARNVRARAEAQYMQLMMVDTTPKRKREFPDVFYKEEKGGFLTREGIPEEIFATSPSYKHQSPPKASPKPSPKPSPNSFEEYDWINVNVDGDDEIDIDIQSSQKEAAQEDVLTVSGFLQKHLESEESLKPKKSKSKLRKRKSKLKPKKSKSKIKKTKSLKEKQSEQSPERTTLAYREKAYLTGVEELVADIPVPDEEYEYEDPRSTDRIYEQFSSPPRPALPALSGESYYQAANVESVYEDDDDYATDEPIFNINEYDDMVNIEADTMQPEFYEEPEYDEDTMYASPRASPFMSRAHDYVYSPHTPPLTRRFPVSPTSAERLYYTPQRKSPVSQQPMSPYEESPTTRYRRLRATIDSRQSPPREEGFRTPPKYVAEHPETPPILEDYYNISPVYQHDVPSRPDFIPKPRERSPTPERFSPVQQVIQSSPSQTVIEEIHEEIIYTSEASSQEDFSYEDEEASWYIEGNLEPTIHDTSDIPEEGDDYDGGYTWIDRYR